jgi:hypothetical protein
MVGVIVLIKLLGGRRGRSRYLVRGIQPDTLTRKAQESFRNMERRLILRHSSYHIGSRTLSSELEVFYADPERAHVGAKTIRGW